MDRGLFPFSKRYLGTLHGHFSTIGVNGINEAIRNFTQDKENISTEWEKAYVFVEYFEDKGVKNQALYIVEYWGAQLSRLLQSCF